MDILNNYIKLKKNIFNKNKVICYNLKKKKMNNNE